MTTLTIKISNNNPAILQALDGWSKMGEIIIDELPVKEKPERIPGLPYTREERIASVRRAEEDLAAGRFITHEEMRAKHQRI